MTRAMAERPQAAPIGRLEGIRGTFSGAALSGFGGAGASPVVQAIERQGDQQREQMDLIRDIRDRLGRFGLATG